MERSHLETKQDWWVDTENESRPEGKTWHYIIVTLGLCFLLFNWEELGQGGGHLKLAIQRQEGRRILDVAGQGGGGPENCTIFIDVICVLCLAFNFACLNEWMKI